MTFRYREMQKTYRRNILRNIKAYKRSQTMVNYELLTWELSEYAGYALANDDYKVYNAILTLRCNIMNSYYRHVTLRDMHIYA